MLKEVFIENLAIIKRLHITFEDGLNIITGETGAGKSVLLHALNLLTGTRATKNMIRTGSNQAYVEGRFALNKAEALLPFLEDVREEEGDDLLLSRSLSKSGRSQHRVNGKLVSLKEFLAIGQWLLDVYGQKDRMLLDHENQLHLLDTFFTEDQKEIHNGYQKAYEALRLHEQFIANNSKDRSAREREIDFLEHQIEEIERFNLAGTDIEALYNEHSRLLHGTDILELSDEMQTYLNGNGLDYEGAETPIGHAWGVAQRLERLDERTDFASRLAQIAELVSDLKRDLADYSQNVETNPERLAEIDEKMTEWTQIQRKYGQDYTEITRFYEDAQQQLKTISEIEAKLERAKKETVRLTEHCLQLAGSLHNARVEIAERLCGQIEDKLSVLRMPGVDFAIDVAQLETLNAHGQDAVTFFIRTNVGMEMRPLHEIASGGELSRVLLAIRSLFAEGIRTDTVVFDEIDAGVSGQAAQSMAEQLYHLSESMQIIAVSHLPQIAAMGDIQYVIQKSTQESETRTQATRLSYEGRIHELSRLISGASASEVAEKQAEALLLAADNWKQNGGHHGLSGKDN